MTIPRLRALALAAVAAVGLLAGHSMTYLGFAPSARHREALLALTGHGYLMRAAAFAGGLAVLGGLYWLLEGALRRRAPAPSPAGNLLALAVIQCLAFSAQEVSERLAAGAPLRGLGSVLLLGLPVQLIVAALGALVVSFLRATGSVLASRLARPRPARARSSISGPVPPAHCRSFRPAGGLRTRGPPLLPV